MIDASLPTQICVLEVKTSSLVYCANALVLFWFSLGKWRISGRTPESTAASAFISGKKGPTNRSSPEEPPGSPVPLGWYGPKYRDLRLRSRFLYDPDGLAARFQLLLLQEVRRLVRFGSRWSSATAAEAELHSNICWVKFERFPQTWFKTGRGFEMIAKMKHKACVRVGFNPRHHPWVEMAAEAGTGFH